MQLVSDACRRAGWWAAAALLVALAAGGQEPVDFSRDIRPILSQKCFTCHGPDAAARAAELRLDEPPAAERKIILPGDPDHSELIRRVTRRGAGKMPPTGDPLSEQQIDLLRRWIEAGGEYRPHWAFVPPVRPAEPWVADGGWARNTIDKFVFQALQQAGLKPQPEDDKARLLRRVTLDLTGLPPTLEELDAFLADDSPDAYEQVVDRLLASPRYGERMALDWLDLARYADTHGYHIDSHRDMWPWRDWVIEAYNRNLPYDQFVTEQLAGDLLPEPALDQLVATGFNRNHPINYEGGAIPEEYLAAYVADRVDTTSTAFLGLTMKCAQCHDHKYDPLSTRDYYRFFAFFNNIEEIGLDGQRGNAMPFIKVPTPEERAKLADYVAKIAALDTAMATRIAETREAQAAWEATALETLQNSPAIAEGLSAHYALNEAITDPVADATGAQPAGSYHGVERRVAGKHRGALEFDGMSHVDLGDVFDFERDQAFSYGGWVKLVGDGPHTLICRMEDARDFRGWDCYISGGNVFAHVIHQWPDNAVRVNTRAKVPAETWTHVFIAYDGSSKAAGVRIYFNGEPQELDPTHDSLSETIHTDVPARLGRRTESAPLRGTIDEVRVYARELTGAEVKQIAAFEGIRPILVVAREQRSEEQAKTVQQFYLLSEDEPYRTMDRERNELVKARDELDGSIVTTMVMNEREELRPTHILERGEYDKPGEQVSPGVPEKLPPLPEGVEANRLGLAKWLTGPDNPLAARVRVNRLWQQIFGTGLVKTVEDFGSQGARPSHPELLDWLAVEYRDSGWDTKALVRLLVCSAAYRQSTRVTPEALAGDPENRLLSRAPRIRLKAEFLRDLALSTSGLLTPTIGGPSVKPYMDPKLWTDVSYGAGFTAQTYEQDHGEKLYRRSMYIFWKRSSPPPMMQTFDAPEREFCVVKRPVTNTPLQALVLWNETGFVEAARKLAERVMHAAPGAEARLDHLFRLCASRPASPRERQVLLELLSAQQAEFGTAPERAAALLKVGESPADETLDPAELAAWTTVCNAVLNLDLVVTNG